MEKTRNSAYADIIRELDSINERSFADMDMSWSKWKLAYDLPSNVVATEITAETNLAPNLKEGMDRTQQELDIVSPYFVPGEEFTQYLINRAAEGIKIRILTNSLSSNDVSLVHAGYMRYREDLIAGGVEIYEFKALRDKQVEARYGKNKIGARRASLHAKFFGFDRRFMFIGSFNLDARSRVLNTELGAYFESQQDARQLAEVFDEQIMYLAYKVELDEDGELEWITRTEDGSLQRVDHEPDTSFWKRFNTRVLSPIVPESEL
jgi:putative cardiolipin synthase